MYMRHTIFTTTCLLAVLFFGLSASAMDDKFESEIEKTPKKKRRSFFIRPACDSAADQLAHATRLLADGKLRAAAKQYRALVHAWHDSPEAPIAQMAYADLLEKRQRYVKAFDEFQYLIVHYAGRFSYEETLKRQFGIAHHLMNARHGKFLFFPGFRAADRAVPLFEQIVGNAPDWERAAESQFYVGVIQEEAGNHEEAVSAYEAVQYRYSGSRHAEEASFRQARGLCVISNTRPRNETACWDAISALDAFLKKYPHSDKAATAEEDRDKLHERLATMYYERALFYDKAAQRKAALIAYDDFLKNFPDSERAEEVGRRMAILRTAIENKQK